MKKIGLFYGPTGGSVERIASKLGNILGDRVEVFPVIEASAGDLDKYENIILGISAICLR